MLPKTEYHSSQGEQRGYVMSAKITLIRAFQDRFVALARKTKLPARRDPGYAEALRTLHSAILGICALIESFPYSVEPWMPPLTDSESTHVRREPSD